MLGERYLPLGEADVGAPDRRDPGDAAGLHPQQSDRPVVLCLHGGLCRAWRARPAFPAGALPGPVLQSDRMRAAGDRRSAADGHLSVGPYFHDASEQRGRQASLPASSLEAAAYACGASAGANSCAGDAGGTLDRPAARLCWHGRSARRSATSPSIRRPSTRPCPCSIGRIEGGRLPDGDAWRKGVAPDPYLSRYDRAETFGRPRLQGRVMSRTLAHPQSRRRQGVRPASRRIRRCRRSRGNCRRSGWTSTGCWPELPAEAVRRRFRLLRCRLGFDEQFPWKAGEAPMPLVALIGSEAPGRIEWALSHNADAQLAEAGRQCRRLQRAADRTAELRGAQASGRRDRRASPAASPSARPSCAPSPPCRKGSRRRPRLCATALSSPWAGRSAWRRRRAASWR